LKVQAGFDINLKLRSAPASWVGNVSRTAIYFTTYYKDLADEIIRGLSSAHRVIKVTRSSVVDGFYYVLIEGDVAEDVVSRLLKRDEVTWFKIERIPPIS
jgi:hypothetical protein